MLTTTKNWLLAGSPAHYILVLVGLYAFACWLLSKSPKIRANTVFEAIANQINPKVVPILQGIPIIGPILAAFLNMMDTPQLPAPDAKVIPIRARDDKGAVDGDALGAAFLFMFCFFFAIVMSLGGGCAHNTVDAARQACTNANDVLSSAYGVLNTTMKLDLEKARQKLAAGDTSMIEKLQAHEKAYDKTLSALDAAAKSESAACSLASTYDAARHGADIQQLEVQLSAIVLNVQMAIEDIRHLAGGP